MVNTSESLINVVMIDKPKVLTISTGHRLEPNWHEVKCRCCAISDHRRCTSGEQARPNPSLVFTRNAVSP